MDSEHELEEAAREWREWKVLKRNSTIAFVVGAMGFLFAIPIGISLRKHYKPKDARMLELESKYGKKKLSELALRQYAREQSLNQSLAALDRAARRAAWGETTTYNVYDKNGDKIGEIRTKD